MLDYWEPKLDGYSRLSRGFMSVIILLCNAIIYELWFEMAWAAEYSVHVCCNGNIFRPGTLDQKRVWFSSSSINPSVTSGDRQSSSPAQ